MIVAADLDRPVAGVGNLDRDRIAVLVQLQLARSGEDSPGFIDGFLVDRSRSPSCSSPPWGEAR